MSNSSSSSSSSDSSNSSISVIGGGPSGFATLDSVFVALRGHLEVNDLVKVHQTVRELQRFIDKVQPCGHCHGRRLPLHHVHELVSLSFSFLHLESMLFLSLLADILLDYITLCLTLT